MYRRILVAVDGSNTSHLALQEALKLAKETKAQLHLVHVIDVTPGVEGGLDPETFHRIVRQDGNDLLSKLASLAARQGSMPKSCYLRRAEETAARRLQTKPGTGKQT
jgi:nucleotide-binding universal stress UspA family protein